MANFKTATVTGLFRYPVKSFAPEALTTAPLAPDQAFPADRFYALQTSKEPEAAKAGDEVVPGLLFLKIIRNPVLAGLACAYDDETRTLSVWRGANQLLTTSLATAEGRMALEDFILAALGPTYQKRAYVISKAERDFSRGMDTYLHIINLASIRDLEARIGSKVDPMRFRPNIIIDGAPAWSELDLLDKQVRIGTAILDVIERAERCPATTCDPATGVSDLMIPDFLRATLGHKDFGIYARVRSPGDVAIGTVLKTAPDQRRS